MRKRRGNEGGREGRGREGRREGRREGGKEGGREGEREGGKEGGRKGGREKGRSEIIEVEERSDHFIAAIYQCYMVNSIHLYTLYRSDLHSNFLNPNALRDRDLLRTTLNQLEWTPAQINGLRDSIYTDGVQVAACINDAGDIVSTLTLQLFTRRYKERCTARHTCTIAWDNMYDIIPHKS